MVSPSDAATFVLRHARARAPTLGGGRLICIDGPGGSGKSSLGKACVDEAGEGARLVHMDDLYDGWGGLATVGDQLATLLVPLASGQPGSYCRYDWHERRFAETVVVHPGPLLLLEGVGSGSRAYADLCTLLVWVSAPPDLRLTRGVDRDGEDLRAEWLAWRRDEEIHFAQDRTEDRADLIVDGTGDRRPHSR